MVSPGCCCLGASSSLGGSTADGPSWLPFGLDSENAYLGLDTALISLQAEPPGKLKQQRGHIGSRPHPVSLAAPSCQRPPPNAYTRDRKDGGLHRHSQAQDPHDHEGGPGDLAWRRSAPVLRVGNGVNDGVVDGRGLGDDGWHRVHVGRQDMRVPRTEKLFPPARGPSPETPQPIHPLRDLPLGQALPVAEPSLAQTVTATSAPWDRLQYQGEF